MIQIVADSSTLILLAKCSLLEILCGFVKIIIPKSVVDEVASEELIRKYPDAGLIFELISKGTIAAQRPGDSRFDLPIKLHEGEKDALLLAFNLKSLFATDDGKAIKAARFLKIPFIITPKMVVELYRLHEIAFQKARNSIEILGKIGRYSPEIIADALISLMEIKNGKADNHKDI